MYAMIIFNLATLPKTKGVYKFGSCQNYILIQEKTVGDIWVGGTDHFQERNWTWTDCSPWNSPDGGNGLTINNQTTPITRMVMVMIASCSLATSRTTSIGLMPPAMLSRDSLFVAKGFVQARLVVFTKI